MTRNLGCAVMALIAVASFTADRVEGQVFTPSYMAPRQASDVGLYLSDGPGSFAVEGIWRRGYGAYDLGLRAGVADTRDVSILIGAELRNPIAVGAPLDLAVTGSAQGMIREDNSGAGFLVGLSLGHTFGATEIAFTPYLHPRAGIVTGFGGGDADLELLADLGFDVRLNPDVEIRFGLALDDRTSAWGIGFAWR